MLYRATAEVFLCLSFANVPNRLLVPELQLSEETLHAFFLLLKNRPSMSGLHLVKQGRDRRRIELQRDFTVASPAEFVTRFGGNKVIEKVEISFPRVF